jgi:hypothetical protein
VGSEGKSWVPIGNQTEAGNGGSSVSVQGRPSENTPPPKGGQQDAAKAAHGIINPGSIKSELFQCAERLITLAELFKFRYDDSTLAHRISLQWEQAIKGTKTSWFKFLKYKIACFYSICMSQPLPPKIELSIEDKPHLLCGTNLGKWFYSQCRQPSEETKENKYKRFEILTSIKNGLKRGLPKPNKNDLKKASQDTYIVLTQTPSKEGRELWSKPWSDSFNWHDRVEYHVTKNNAIEQIQRTVREIFKGHIFTHKERVKVFFPSTSANYIRNRLEMGMVGYILDQFQHLRKPGGYISVVAARRKINSIDKFEIKENLLDEIRNNTPEIILDITDLEAACEKLWFEILNIAKHSIGSDDNRSVSLVALAEALKTRVISKGPPELYYVMRNLWKFTHTILRQHPTFKFIGQPINWADVQKSLGKNLKDNEIFLSGDYSMATDLIYSWASETVAREIADCIQLSAVEKELFLISLTGHLIENPENELEFKEQARGQLMGSITSFPVLCIINAAMCRWALEITNNKPMQLKQCPLMINGDDNAIKADRSIIEIWRGTTQIVGFQESLGKTFFSRNFVEMNSTTFIYEPEGTDTLRENDDGTKFVTQQHYFQVPFVNFGLIYGMKRSSARTNLSGKEGNRRSEGTIGARARELLNTCPINLQESSYRLFIKENKEALSLHNIPWFIPEWLGGLGLPCTEYFKPSELDMRVAHQILLNWKDRRPKAIKPGVTWHIRDLTNKMIEPMNIPSVRVKSGTGHENLESIHGFLSVNLLLDSNVGVSEIYYESEEDLKKTYRWNEKLWKPRSGKLPPPLTLEEIEYKPAIEFCSLLLIEKEGVTISQATEINHLYQESLLKASSPEAVELD